MGRIDDLIQQYCPEGVEYAPIKELGEIGTGSSNRQDASENGAYPFFVRSKDVFRNDTYEFDEEAILIPGEGGIGDIFHYYKGKYALHQRTYRIHLSSPKLKTKFLYYYMFANFKDYIMKKAVAATVTSIRKPMIENFEIPLPPLPVQEAIVEILEKFDRLSAELQAELQARKQQYEYYRNQLLTRFAPDQPVTEYSLGELFVFKNGLNASKEQFGHGKPIVNYVNVYKKCSIVSEDLQGRVDLDKTSIDRYRVQRGDVFFTRTSETQDEIGIASVLLEDIEDCVFSGFVLRARPITNFLLPEYCKYCFSTNNVRRQIIRSSTLTTRALTNGTSLSKVKILVPSIEEQARIVAILDKFEALVNDLSQGLPAEIAAVQEQYEYYRNKLLTFKTKE